MNARCSRCHYRGHKADKPCELPECESSFDCGFKDLHPEHNAELFSEESKLKGLQKRWKEIEQDIEAARLINERSTTNFFVAMRPRLVK